MNDVGERGKEVSSKSQRLRRKEERKVKALNHRGGDAALQGALKEVLIT
jgi:hypothetical protein